MDNITEIQTLMIEIYKEAYLDGYIHGSGIKKISMKEKKELWKKIADKAYKNFQKKFIKMKGGKN